MSSLRCLVGIHQLGGLVGRGDVLAVRCSRCDRISVGIAIDGPRPRVTQPKAPRSPIWWLRGIYERKA